MAKPIDDDVLIDLQRVVCQHRALEAARASEEEFATAQLATYRSFDHLDILRHNKRQRETGWHDPSKVRRPGDPKGRGWHDATQPAKLGA